jgi:drug/metabolite transporter (DMT)-like permease
VGSPPRWAVYAWLAVGVASVSAAAIFIRLADAEPMTVAAYRMALGAALVAAPTLARARPALRAVRRADLPLLALSALFLAGTTLSFTASLSLTSVASSVLLVTTAPVFVAAGSHLLLRERVGRLTAAAVAVSLAGGAVLALGAWDGESRRLMGDGLALMGAITVAAHMIVGRRLRRHIANLPYITIVYAIAGALLLGSAIASGAPMLGLSAETYFWIALAAVLPQAVGHSLLNWSLGHMPATNVALAVRVEPIVATLLAIPVLGEVPPWTVVPGGALVLAGVYLAIRGEASSGRPRG